MKKYSLFLLVPLVLLLASTSFATIVSIPVVKKDFVRKKGAPFTDHLPFKAFSGLATIKLYNGGTQNLAGKNVTDATIRINGSNIFNENEFKPIFNLLQKDIYLFEGDNDLEVFIEGKPGSLINIYISQNVDNENEPNPGFPLLMQGAILFPRTPPEISTLNYETEEGKIINIEVAKGRIIIQFNSDLNEEIAEQSLYKNGGKVIAKIPIIGLYEVEVNQGNEMVFINKMRQEPNVLYVIPDMVVDNLLYKENPKEITYLASFSKSRKYLDEIKAPKAWNLIQNKSRRKVDIGIIDKDWCTKYWPIYDYSAFHDSDFEGRIINLSWGLGCYGPLSGHPQHGFIVTAVAAARGDDSNNNNIGIYWDGNIYIDDAIWGPSPIAFFWTVLGEISDMESAGAEVINLSMSGEGYSYRGQDYFLRSIGGTMNEINKKTDQYLVVVGAGNTKLPLTVSQIFNKGFLKPNNLIVVGGSINGARAVIDNKIGSNGGDIIDIAAPWYIQYYYDYDSGYYILPEPELGGTSMSTPMVSGAAALLWAYSPSCINKPPCINNATDVANRLKNTAINKGNIDGFGQAGILDVCRALALSFQEIDPDSSCGILPPPPGPIFTQADLTGTWDLFQFQVGGEGAGWFRAVVNLDVSGNISIVNYEDTMGDSNPPGPTELRWTINTNGNVTETGDISGPSFHSTMASNKQLIVGTVTLDPSTKAIRVARKRVPGVVFNTSDILNKTFAYHALSYGALRKWWEYGFGYMDSTGKSTIASYVDPDGTHIGQSEYNMSIDSEGIVTRSGNSTFKGIMTPDKSAIFVVATMEPGFGTIYSLGVLQITGQTFSQQDLAGTYGFYDLFVSQSDDGWLHGKVSINSAGLGSFTDMVDDIGPRAPFTASFTLAQDGTVTIPGNPTLHGTFSRTGNLIATTHTNSLGGFELGLFVK